MCIKTPSDKTFCDKVFKSVVDDVPEKKKTFTVGSMCMYKLYKIKSDIKTNT